MSRSNVNISIKRPFVTFEVLAIAMFVLIVTICEIMTFELPNVFERNLWPLKWRSKKLTNWLKIGRWTVLVNVHRCAKIGSSRSSSLFAVTNRTFRGGCTYVRRSTRHANITQFHLHWNGVKIVACVNIAHQWGEKNVLSNWLSYIASGTKFKFERKSEYQIKLVCH